jgi:hypothetical protein
MKEQFKGQTGRLYVRNPFGGEEYTFAVFRSQDHYDGRDGRRLPDRYVKAAEAYQDFEDEKKPGFEFRLTTPDGIEVITTDLDGNYKGGVFKDHLKQLKEKHGNNIQYTYKNIDDVSERI